KARDDANHPRLRLPSRSKPWGENIKRLGLRPRSLRFVAENSVVLRSVPAVLDGASGVASSSPYLRVRLRCRSAPSLAKTTATFAGTPWVVASLDGFVGPVRLGLHGRRCAGPLEQC